MRWIFRKKMVKLGVVPVCEMASSSMGHLHFYFHLVSPSRTSPLDLRSRASGFYINISAMASITQTIALSESPDLTPSPFISP